MMRTFSSGLLTVLLAAFGSARGDSSAFLNFPVANNAAKLMSVTGVAMVETGSTDSTGCEADFEDLGSYLLWHLENNIPYLVMHNNASPPYVGIRSLVEWPTIAEIRDTRYTFKKNIHTQQYIVHRLGDANKRIVVRRSADSNGRHAVEFHGPDFDPAVWQDNFVIRQSTQAHYNVRRIFLQMQILTDNNTVNNIILSFHRDHKKLYGTAQPTTADGHQDFMLGNRLRGLKGATEIAERDIIMIESKYYNGWVGTKTNDHMGTRSRDQSRPEAWHEFVDISRNDANSGNSDSFKLKNLLKGFKLRYRNEGYDNWKSADLLKYQGSGDEARMLVCKVNGDDTWWKWSRKDGPWMYTETKNNEWVVWADGFLFVDPDKFMFYRYYNDPTAVIRITASTWM